MAKRVLLKKYANRRLYDTERSAYVTLQQVGDLIKDGRQVAVIDAQTQEDVTAFILTQIVVEQAKNKSGLLPVSLLHLIIQYGENVLNEFFEKYLELTIRNYLSYRASFDEQFRKWLDVGKDFSLFAQKTMPAIGQWKSLMDAFAGPEKELQAGERGKGDSSA